MFVRICNKGFTETHECKSVKIASAKAEGRPNEKMVTIILDNNDKTQKLIETIFESGNEVILMNSEGRTIDRKVF